MTDTEAPDMRHEYGLFPPNVACVCTCFGAAHYVRWVGDTFKGTRCDGDHGGHKFQPEARKALEEEAQG